MKQFEITHRSAGRLQKLLILFLMVVAVGISPWGTALAATAGVGSWSEAGVTLAGNNNNWQDIASSADGSKVIAITYNNYFYTSTDGGLNWTERRVPLSHHWTSVTTSADGMRLTVVSYDGLIETSTDGGVTWTERTVAGVGTWYHVASSADGMSLFGVGDAEYLYTSNDGGVSWNPLTTAGVKTWNSITTSADGRELIASAGEGLYVSHDSGATWNEEMTGVPGGWFYVTISPDGAHAVATTIGVWPDKPSLYTSSDGGLTWQERTSLDRQDFVSIQISSDGSTMLAASYLGSPQYENISGYIYISHDGGSTWTKQISIDRLNWTAMAMSQDATKIAGVSSSNRPMVISSDGGSTWKDPDSIRTTYGFWQDVASSGDGKKLLAATDQTGYLLSSSDGGQTWKELPSAGSLLWQSVASSADGMKLTAIGLDSTNSGYIYTSSDGGVTWTERTNAGYLQWGAVASSSDGATLAATGLGDGGVACTFISSDSGATWTAHACQAAYVSLGNIAVSADGARMLLAVENGPLYYSSDRGNTWTERSAAGTRSWYAVASSADGTKLVAADRTGGIEPGGYLYTSADSGVTWKEQTSLGVGIWQDVTTSADGLKLVAGKWGGDLYVSTDGGSTWVEQTELGKHDWFTLASSLDGSKVIAGAYHGALYVGSFSQPSTGVPITADPSPAPSFEPPKTTPRTVITLPQSHVEQVEPTLADTMANATSPEALPVDLESSPVFRSGRGQTIKLTQGQIANFTVGRDHHSVTIDRVESDQVTFTLRSTPQTVTLKVGQTGKYDVNEDGQPDISVTLSSITDGTATLSFASIIPSHTTGQTTSRPADEGKRASSLPIIITVGVAGAAIILGFIVRGARRR